MGRPLNKRFFGTPTAGGNEIKVQFHNGTGSVAGWIVKQKASKRFLCSDGTNTAVCTLTDAASAALTAGQMSITVLNDSGDQLQVTKISGRKVTGNDGNTYPWNFDADLTDGGAQIEEAGDDSSLTNADDLEGDETP